jgi:hypothetical protein
MVVVVAVAVTLAALYGAGILLPRPSSTPATALPYSKASAVASTFEPVASGNWSLLEAVGVVSPSVLWYQSSGYQGCSVPAFSIPSFSGSSSQGIAPFWIFEYVAFNGGSASPGVLVITVVNGSAQLLTQWPSGTACTSSFTVLPPLWGPVLDSPTVASDALSAGGADFLKSEPGTVTAFTLTEQIGSPPNPLWTVSYDPCGFLGAGGTLTGSRPTLEVAYEATSATVAYPQNGTETCANPTPYTAQLSVVDESQTAAGYYYNLSVAMSASLPLDKVGVAVATSTGAGLTPWVPNNPYSDPSASANDWRPPPQAWSVVLLGPGGASVGVYPVPYPGLPDAWEETGPGGDPAIASADMLEILSSTPLIGDTVSVFGLNGVSVSGNVPITEPSSSETPLSTVLAVGTPSEAVKGSGAATNNWYNFTVQSAGGGITLGGFKFQVVSAAGVIITPGAGWTMSALSLTGTTIGTYSFTSDGWTTGGTTTITSSQTFVLDAVQASSLSAQGNYLKVIGTGSFEGSILVIIP